MEGVNAVDELVTHVTHHLVEVVSPVCSIAHSLLLATQLVRPDWLHEIIRLGNLSTDAETLNTRSLESSFALPPVAKYLPSLSVLLPSSLKMFKVWEPNEERVNLLIGYRFVFVGEKGREVDVDVRQMVVAGGAEYEAFNVSGGRSKFHQVLAKGMRRVSETVRRGKGLVVVADEESMKTAIGSIVWKEFQGEMRRL